MFENVTDLVYHLLRIVVVHGRLIVQTPATWLPATALSAAVLLACARLREDSQSKAWTSAVTGLTFISGLVVLLWFVQFGRLSWTGADDWVKDWTYYSALEQAVERGVLPYYMRSSFQQTDRYLANLETLAAPHAVLLAVVNVNTFFVIHLIAAYAAGFAGLVRLRRDLDLSLFSWTVFVVIFLLNGHITAHLSVGHTQWVGYFLVPWLLAALVRAVKGDTGVFTVVTLAVTFTVLIAIGSWHLFIACVLLTGFVAMTSWARLRCAAAAFALSAALSAYRLLPAWVTYGGGNNEFLASFSSIALVYDALNGQAHTIVNGVRWHEYDTYVGHIGVGLLVAGLVPARDRSRRFTNALLIGSVGLVAVSMYGVYEATLFRLPGFVSQRVVSRFVVIAMLAVALVGCVKLDAWGLRRLRQSRLAWASAGALAVFLIVQLVIHAAGWRPPAGVPPVPVDALKTQLIEAEYAWALAMGTMISLLTAAASAKYVWSRRHMAEVQTSRGPANAGPPAAT